MILTDYYKAEKLPEIKSKYRYEITVTTGNYDLFETDLLNKRDPNKGGLSFNLVPRSLRWKNIEKSDLAITRKGNISSLIIPDPEQNNGYGNINKTHDACLFVFNPDFRIKGITYIEIFVARGQKHNERNLYYLLNDFELEHEIEDLREKGYKICNP